MFSALLACPDCATDNSRIAAYGQMSTMCVAIPRPLSNVLGRHCRADTAGRYALEWRRGVGGGGWTTRGGV